ncbi:PREDICTED: calcium homeostasis endoplasmic reticulum protein-like [Priapulus caudatus]|uniref:Calcium homeostasis endoplasmic reticulum protein-like n=1 Tax=Priapulus caudatus TaxID=37621 RepID=A0ABM1FBG1_PRICU|nr:PREDICTED: calcium homeostasis endoplasmic reticulum protein-like [Priapulus caudatus]
MSVPKSPEDVDLRNIIDKLANFVARNGSEFEQMTKTKQKDNPKFSFLFGGEYFNYYQYKVTTEQAIIKQQQKKLQDRQVVQLPVYSQAGHAGPLPPGISGVGQGPPVMPAVWVNTQQQLQQAEAAYQQQKEHAEQQIIQSEQNLAAQYQVMMQGQQSSIQEGVAKAENERLELQAEECGVEMSELNNMAQSIIDSCTKDAISVRCLFRYLNTVCRGHCKIVNSSTQLIINILSSIQEGVAKAENERLELQAEECGVEMSELNNMAQSIIDSCTKDAISNGKNWIFNHNLSEQHSMVIATYLLRRITAKETPFEAKLHLVYLINDILHHCVRKNAGSLKTSLEAVVVPIFCSTHMAADVPKQEKLAKLLGLWEKNEYFSPRTLEQLKNPAASVSNYQVLSFSIRHFFIVAHALPWFIRVDTCYVLGSAAAQAPVSSQAAPPSASQRYPPPPSFQQPPLDFSKPPPDFSNQIPPLFGSPRPPPFPPAVPVSVAPIPPNIDFSKPPPGFPAILPPNFNVPPPAAAPVLDANDPSLFPSVPYYELPAGLMVPLVRLEDCDYKSLNPDDIRLPPPMPPNERLLAAVEAFYRPPSHERPRTAEGWEKLGLYEFFKAKKQALQDQRAKGVPPRSRSRGRSKSTSPRSRSRSSSRSLSPPRRRRYSDRVRSRSRSKSRSRTPPRTRRGRSRSRSVSKSRSRSRSVTPPSYRRRSPVRRSRSPHSFMGPMHSMTLDTKLDESNKGHMLMKRMGWGGAGLGAAEQGIQDPITQGEVRDRVDMYKGVGISVDDPFENFRKSKSQGFIQRMKEAQEAQKKTTASAPST